MKRGEGATWIHDRREPPMDLQTCHRGAQLIANDSTRNFWTPNAPVAREAQRTRQDTAPGSRPGQARSGSTTTTTTTTNADTLVGYCGKKTAENAERNQWIF